MDDKMTHQRSRNSLSVEANVFENMDNDLMY